MYASVVKCDMNQIGVRVAPPILQCKESCADDVTARTTTTFAIGNKKAFTNFYLTYIIFFQILEFLRIIKDVITQMFFLNHHYLYGDIFYRMRFLFSHFVRHYIRLPQATYEILKIYLIFANYIQGYNYFVIIYKKQIFFIRGFYLMFIDII